MENIKDGEKGFTLVEAVVTLFILSLAIASIVSSFSIVSTLSAIESQRTKASFLAYNNMRDYANDRPPNWFACNNSSPGATQQVLVDTSGAVDGLPGTVTQKVVASAPYGCGGATDHDLGMPIRIESTVTYGNGGKVSHATYAAF